MNKRNGVTVELARRDVRRKTSLIGALMVERGDADGMILWYVWFISLALKLRAKRHQKHADAKDFMR